MRLLVLGGTHHVGRAVVEVALARGDQVTTLTRGTSGPSAAGAEERHADRTDPAQLRAALGDDTWDAVIDTWSGAPRVVLDSGRLLAGRAGHYGYVSSRSVHQWPLAVGADESAPVVDGDAASDAGDDYAAAKRGGELAAIEAFGDRALLARAGLILGPYEGVGRMPWWLRRIERGGDVLAPGPADMPLQYIDCRDLAAWMLTAADRGLGGAFSTVSQPGHATMRSLLEAAVAAVGSDARLVWVAPEVIEAAGIEGWTELPVWVPPVGEAAGLHTGDVSKAYAAGLTCRPVAETVADTWAWLQAEGDPPEPRPGRPRHGLDPDRERAVLAGRPVSQSASATSEVMDASTVAAYLGRIDAARPQALDAAALGGLHHAHQMTVPFENLSIHLSEPISLTAPDLLDKIISRRRGGFCYELNGAFALLLQALGAGVVRVAARVYGDSGLSPPFDHMALIVTPGDGSGRWLADVGFGSHATFPLRLDERGEQDDPGGRFQVADAPDGDVDVLKDGRPQYRVELRERSQADFGPTCWYQQTAPQSHFRASTICSRLTADGRISLSGQMVIRTGGGVRTEEELAGDAAVLAAYRDLFGITLDRVPRLP